jgi:hypothetical protein
VKDYVNGAKLNKQPLLHHPFKAYDLLWNGLYLKAYDDLWNELYQEMWQAQ